MSSRIDHCYCGKEGNLKWCGKCKTTKYCSKECQKKDWPRHKLHCEYSDPHAYFTICELREIIDGEFGSIIEAYAHYATNICEDKVELSYCGIYQKNAEEYIAEFTRDGKERVEEMNSSIGYVDVLTRSKIIVGASFYSDRIYHITLGVDGEQMYIKYNSIYKDMFKSDDGVFTVVMPKDFSEFKCYKLAEKKMTQYKFASLLG
jgi:hypothetical protein